MPQANTERGIYIPTLVVTYKNQTYLYYYFYALNTLN